MKQVQIVYPSGIVEFETDDFTVEVDDEITGVTWGNPPFPNDFRPCYLNLPTILAVLVRDLPTAAPPVPAPDVPVLLCDRCQGLFLKEFDGSMHRLAEFAEFTSDLESLNLCPSCFFTLTDAEYHHHVPILDDFARLAAEKQANC